MGCLYIAGAISTHAKINDWTLFDDSKKSLSELATSYGVFITRKNMDRNTYFVISNIALQTKTFYEDADFNYDMAVELDTNFEQKAHAFIEALNKHPDFLALHNLDWSEAARRYYVNS